MSEQHDMVYVALDRNQPGAAYAICVDAAEYKKDTARTVAEWIADGASVQHCTREEGLAMIDKWIRPGKQEKLL